MNDRFKLIAAVAALIAIPVLAFVLIIAPLQSKATSNDHQLADAESTNAQHDAQIGALKTAAAQLAALKLQVAALDAALPAKAQMGTLLAEVGQLAAAHNVTVTSFTNSAETVAAAAAASAAAAAAPTVAATPTATATASAPTTSTTTSSAASNGLTAIPVQIEVQGTEKSVRAFLGALQTGPRIIAVTTVTISGDATGDFDGTIAGNAYTLAAAN